MKKIIASFFAFLYKQALLASQAAYRWLPFRVRRVKARVISIGNITWGGTGKTPLTIKLARELSESGKKVAVLTRGYGQDEVAELEKKLAGIPVKVGRDRIKTARAALRESGAEFLILDDGFQHIRLHRDLDVVNINATMPFGPGGLIPLGTLREPLEHLARAHVFILTKSDIGSKNVHWIRQKLLSIKPNAVIFEAVHKPVQLMDFKRNKFLPLTEVTGRKVAVISGIGDPFSFEKSVENIGAEIVLAARFDDHHDFTENEIAEFIKKCRELGVKEAVTTEKDYYRIQPVLKKKRSQDFAAFNFLVLEIEFQIHDEEDFIRRCVNS